MPATKSENGTGDEGPGDEVDQGQMTSRASSPQGESARGSTDPHERRYQRASTAMVVIAVLLSLFTLYFARAILMPIVAGIVLALLFRPVVRRCRHYHVPDAVSAGVVVLLIVVVVLGVFANLIGPANEWLSDAPEKMRTVGTKLHVIRDRVKDFNRASEMVEELAKGDDSPAESNEAPFPFAPEPVPDRVDANADGAEDENAVDSSGEKKLRKSDNTSVDSAEESPTKSNDEPVEVQIQQPRLVAGLQVLSSTGTILGELVITLVLTYFLLASGDVLIKNVLRVLPSMREKRNAVELVYNVERGISAYLLMVSTINVCLGIVVGIAMWLLGLPNPVLWGAMATLFNFVPFLGALCGTVVILLVSILSFDSLSYALIPPLVFWAITATEGNLITPHLLGRSMSLNPIMVFLSLAIWGWMWGVGGALLAVPILAMLKVGFDQFERTKMIGTLLGGE